MHIALDFELFFLGTSTRPFTVDLVKPKTLLEICRVCNIADPQFVKKYLWEHSSLFHTKFMYDTHKQKYALTYHAAYQLHKFFFDPGRSQHLYSASWIIGKCWENLEYALGMRLKSDCQCSNCGSLELAPNLNRFFTPEQGCQLSSTSLMLSAETIKNGSESNRLLHFLKFLSKIFWLDICFDNNSSEICTQAIAQWVCVALVS